jgi:hypothetical protein
MAASYPIIEQALLASMTEPDRRPARDGHEPSLETTPNDRRHLATSFLSASERGHDPRSPEATGITRKLEEYFGVGVRVI